MNRRKINVFSPAKINFFLHIGPKREDGYHSIESLMIPLRDFGDTLTIHTDQTASPGVHVDVQFNDDLAARFPAIHPENNLVSKACDLFLKKTNISSSIRVTLFKRIPLGAGLGGGSSNAATTLMALNTCFDNSLSQDEMIPLGLSLGSDVPFFFSKQSAHVSGRGEHILPASFKSEGWFVILNPGFQIPTVWAYQKWDSHTSSSLTKKRRNGTYGPIVSTSGDWAMAKKNCVNDFEHVVFQEYPKLKQARNTLIERGAEVASLSGSGPTLFGLFTTKMLAQEVAAYFKQKEWLTWVSQGV